MYQNHQNVSYGYTSKQIPLNGGASATPHQLINSSSHQRLRRASPLTRKKIYPQAQNPQNNFSEAVLQSNTQVLNQHQSSSQAYLTPAAGRKRGSSPTLLKVNGHSGYLNRASYKDGGKRMTRSRSRVKIESSNHLQMPKTVQSPVKVVTTTKLANPSNLRVQPVLSDVLDRKVSREAYRLPDAAQRYQKTAKTISTKIIKKPEKWPKKVINGAQTQTVPKVPVQPQKKAPTRPTPPIPSKPSNLNSKKSGAENPKLLPTVTYEATAGLLTTQEDEWNDDVKNLLKFSIKNLIGYTEFLQGAIKLEYIDPEIGELINEYLAKLEKLQVDFRNRMMNLSKRLLSKVKHHREEGKRITTEFKGVVNRAKNCEFASVSELHLWFAGFTDFCFGPVKALSSESSICREDVMQVSTQREGAGRVRNELGDGNSSDFSGEGSLELSKVGAAGRGVEGDSEVGGVSPPRIGGVVAEKKGNIESLSLVRNLRTSENLEKQGQKMDASGAGEMDRDGEGSVEGSGYAQVLLSEPKSPCFKNEDIGVKARNEDLGGLKRSLFDQPSGDEPQNGCEPNFMLKKGSRNVIIVEQENQKSEQILGKEHAQDRESNTAGHKIGSMIGSIVREVDKNIKMSPSKILVRGSLAGQNQPRNGPYGCFRSSVVSAATASPTNANIYSRNDLKQSSPPEKDSLPVRPLKVTTEAYQQQKLPPDSPKVYQKPKRSEIRPEALQPEIIKNQALAAVLGSSTNQNQLLKRSRRYFEGFSSKSCRIQSPELNLNKIAICPNSSNYGHSMGHLYLYSIHGTSVLSFEGSHIEQILPTYKSFGATMLKVSSTPRPLHELQGLANGLQTGQNLSKIPKNHHSPNSQKTAKPVIIIQEAFSNDLMLFKRDNYGGLELTKRLKGTLEACKPVEDFHRFQHSKDTTFMLWRSGLGTLNIVDLQTFEIVEELDDFWRFEGLQTEPLAACADCFAERILSISRSSDNQTVVHYYENSRKKNIHFKKAIFDVFEFDILKATCLEVSREQDIAFIAGVDSSGIKQSGPNGVLVACRFREDLLELDCLSFLEDPELLDLGTPRIMKRVEGTDILILACRNNIAIFNFSQNSFKKIATMKALHQQKITDFVLYGSQLFSRGQDEDILKITKFCSEAEDKVDRLKKRRTGAQGVELAPQNVEEEEQGPKFPQNDPKFEKLESTSKRHSINISAAPGLSQSTMNHIDHNRPSSSSFLETKLTTESTDNSKYDAFHQLKLRLPGISGGLEKLALSPTRQELYVGGNGLHKLTQKHGLYSTTFIDNNKNYVLFGLDCLPNGQLLVQEATTNDLLLLDPQNFKVLNSLESKQMVTFEARYLRGSFLSAEQGIAVWLCGTNSLALVDLETLKPNFLDNIFPFLEEKSLVMITRAVAREGGKGLILLYLFKNTFFLCTNVDGRTTWNQAVSDFLPNFSKVYALEINHDSDIVFSAGTTFRSKGKQTQGCLAAMSFQQTPKLLASKIFDDLEVSKCSAVRKVPRRDDLLVGCVRHLMVVEFTGSDFLVKNMIYDVHSGPVCDILLFDNRIMSVSRDDEYISDVRYTYL